MTTTKSTTTNVVVVDGSNIATEGRSMPSLTQLNDAVMAFRAEYPDATVTVVVDATFGHRIDKSEVAEFDAAVAHNELVAPPAGAIGRGDAFVLNIASKVGARILTNDSYQEFHGQYPWLFDEGRLIGGKPVPHVGWVFVDRLPVKGPTSRKAQRAARPPKESVRRTASKAASQPMPVPSSPPPGGRAPRTPAVPPAPTAPPTVPTGPAVNDLLPFLEFVEQHPVGSSVNGVVESYSSHGAYVTLGDLRGYVPLRLMAEQPPRSAREVMRVGDAVTLVVVNFAPARRSVDLAVPAMAPGAVQPTPELELLADVVADTDVPVKTKRGRRQPAEAAVAATDAATAGDEVAEAPPPARRRRGRAAVAAPGVPVGEPAVTPAATAEAAAGDGEVAAAAPAPAKRTRRKAAARAAESERAAAEHVPAPADAAVEQPSPVAPVEPDAPARRPRAKKTSAAPAAAATGGAPRRRRAVKTTDSAPADSPTTESAPTEPAAIEAAAPDEASPAPANTLAAKKRTRGATRERGTKKAAAEPSEAPAEPAAAKPARARKAAKRATPDAAASLDGAPIADAPTTRRSRKKVST
jgi:hypothetical protein